MHTPKIGWRLDISLLIQGDIAAELRTTNAHNNLEVHFCNINFPEHDVALFAIPNVLDMVMNAKTMHPAYDDLGYNAYMSKGDGLGQHIVETVEMLNGTVDGLLRLIDFVLRRFLVTNTYSVPKHVHITPTPATARTLQRYYQPILD